MVWIGAKARLFAVVSLTVLLGFARPAAAQMAGPKQSKPVVTIRGGGVDKDALPFSSARAVKGTVFGADDKVMANAQVYLKDETTLDVRTMLADEKGVYLFGELPRAHDYTVWADVNGKKTPVRPVSSFLETREVTVNLRLKDEPAGESYPKTCGSSSR